MSRTLSITLFILTMGLRAATAAPTPEQIKQVAAEMVCLCGDCNRQSLATCICDDFAVPERERIGQLLTAGKSSRQIVDAYIEEFGAHILAAPPARGYSLIAWVGPFVGLIAGFFAVRAVLGRWRRLTTGSTDRDAAGPAAEQGEEEEESSYRTRLERELDEFDEES